MVQNDEMEQINTNAMIRGLFLSATMQAAVHLGKDDQENLRTTNNTDFDKIKPLLDITPKLIVDQEHDIHIYIYIEIYGIYLIDWDTIPWGQVLCCATLLSSCGQQKSTSSRIRCFVSEAELLGTHDLWCLGKTKLNGFRNLLSIVSWTISTLKVLQEIQSMMEKNHIQPDRFKDRIIFMSMYNDIELGQKRQ